MNYWTNEMKEKNNMDRFIIALAGNKCDVDSSMWQITPDMVSELNKGVSNPGGQPLIQENTSARTGVGVKELFLKIAEQIVK